MSLYPYWIDCLFLKGEKIKRWAYYYLLNQHLTDDILSLSLPVAHDSPHRYSYIYVGLTAACSLYVQEM